MIHKVFCSLRRRPAVFSIHNTRSCLIKGLILTGRGCMIKAAHPPKRHKSRVCAAPGGLQAAPTHSGHPRHEPAREACAARGNFRRWFFPVSRAPFPWSVGRGLDPTGRAFPCCPFPARDPYTQQTAPGVSAGRDPFVSGHYSRLRRYAASASRAKADRPHTAAHRAGSASSPVAGMGPL